MFTRPVMGLAILSFCAHAQTALSAGITAQIDASVKRILDTTGVPSASIAIVKDGQIAYVEAYGKARLSPLTEARPEMRYSIGSISKQFTAAAILLLMEDGKLSLDDPVSKFLPDLTRAREITVRMLLSHTSGYQDYWPEDYVMTSMLQPATVEDILSRWARKPLDFDPGTKWQYSNTNYVIAGRIAEIAGGKPLLDQLEERIFKPLNMISVYNIDASRLPSTDSSGYYRHALGPLRPAPKEGAGWLFAAGELAMSAHDLALWNISMMNRTLMKPQSYEEMWKDVKLKNGKETGYGLGVSVGERNKHRFISHSGEVSGFVADNTVFPDDKAAITVLTNQDASPAASAIAAELRPTVIGRSKEEERALSILTGLQKGQLDRSQLTEFCNAYFTAEAVEDFAGSLKGLGNPISFQQGGEEHRGGMIFRIFRAEFPDRRLTVTTYEMPDGKLEQFLVIPSR
ncbi:MAG: beta-lactamase family protein [Acidobacteriaceae bacterium]|nr:beta-lactamase family protein [Acidobacteriaceae bacterium]